MAAGWTNADGLQVFFPNFWKDPSNFVNRPRALNTLGLVKEVVIDYDLRYAPAGTQFPDDLNNDGTRDGFDEGRVYIPANSQVLSCELFVTEAAASGTSLAVGTFTKVGGEIDADGLFTATNGATANIDNVGDRVVGSGTQVTVASSIAPSVGTADAYLAITTAGTFTAGKGRILIKYVDPLGDSA